jgi:hypothetical protein
MSRAYRRRLVVLLYAGITALLGVTFATGGLRPGWWLAAALPVAVAAYAHWRLHTFGVNFVDAASDEAQRLRRRLVFGDAFHELYHAVSTGYVVLVVAVTIAAGSEARWLAARSAAQFFYLTAWYVLALPSAYVGWLAPDDEGARAGAATQDRPTLFGHLPAAFIALFPVQVGRRGRRPPLAGASSPDLPATPPRTPARRAPPGRRQ